ncbi:hypothetical protein [Novosphingopyxis sp. YJ-S2-01]|uniref:hypothetical protein n=1 Tax=Novosphingopyxis sp. YJ-S2-01 TaxID=2794021 RepID=UPI0018DB0EEA|nr:hypothetical protein [Novosphingopyxis sp. YJ-S2-01]
MPVGNVSRVQISALVCLSNIPPLFYIDTMGGRRIWPASFRTIGAMIDSETVARAKCTCCGNFFDVDLPALQLRRGDNFTLINRHLVCKITSCRGTGFFAAAAHLDDRLVTLFEAALDPLDLGELTPRDLEPPEPPTTMGAALARVV